MADMTYDLHIQDTTRGRVTPVLHAFYGRWPRGFLNEGHIGSYDRATGDAAGEAAWREAMAVVAKQRTDAADEADALTYPSKQ